MMSERTCLLFSARLANESFRFNDLIQNMRRIVQMDVLLTAEERGLLCRGMKIEINQLRNAWENIQRQEQKIKDDIAYNRIKNFDLVYNSLNVVKGYRLGIECQLRHVCTLNLNIIAKLLRFTKYSAERILYQKMMADHYRYLAMFTQDNERIYVADMAFFFYKDALEAAEAELPAKHPIRLRAALNFSLYFYKVYNMVGPAINIAQQAYNDSLAEVENFNLLNDKDTTCLMKLLHENIEIWSKYYNDGVVVGEHGQGDGWRPH